MRLHLRMSGHRVHLMLLTDCRSVRTCLLLCCLTVRWLRLTTGRTMRRPWHWVTVSRGLWCRRRKHLILLTSRRTGRTSWWTVHIRSRLLLRLRRMIRMRLLLWRWLIPCRLLLWRRLVWDWRWRHLLAMWRTVLWMTGWRMTSWRWHRMILTHRRSISGWRLL